MTTSVSSRQYIQTSTHKIGEIFTFSTEKNADRAISEVFTISAEHGLISQRKYFNKSVSSENLSNYYVVRKDYFAYNRSFSKGYPVGVIKRHKAGKVGIVSPIYFVLKPNTKIVNLDFLELILEAGILNEQIKAVSHEGARGHGLLNIRREQFMGLTIPLPPYDDQVRIAKILGKVSENIQATTAIVNHTLSLRSALLKLLFTSGINHAARNELKSGTLPSSWQLVELDTVAKRGSGHTPNKKDPAYYNGGIKWISLADTSGFDNGEISETKYYISDLGIKNSSAVLHRKGSVVLSRDAGVGKSAVMSDDMAVSQHFMVWDCGKELSNWYLYYYLQSQKTEFERIAVGSTIKTIGLQYFKSLKIPLPPLQEQNEIANVLKAVDAKININRKLIKQQLRLRNGLMQDLLHEDVSA